MTYRKNFLVVFLALLASIVGFVLLITTAAHANATAEAFGPRVESRCPVVSDFYVNEDETDRVPVSTPDGLKFTGSDLVHHIADVALADLKPGAYVATPAPDQPSFFSVEVSDPTTNGYATLRWNTGTQQWDAVLKGTLVSHADPTGFIGEQTKWGGLTPAARVSTFGVGYTANPPGAGTTTVSEVIFAGTHYPLTCKPSPSSSTSSPTPAHTHTPAAASASAVAGTLPVTGPNWFVFAAAATGFLAFGGVLLLAARRRRNRFIP